MGVSHPSGRPDVTGGQAQAYYCDTRSLNAVQVEEGLRLLSSEERKRHDRLSLARDKRDYTAAHALLRIALAAHTNTPAEQLLFGVNAYGKPYLLPTGGSAEPPSFSLAHSRGLVACVIASGSAVGIDVEAVDVSVRATEIARHFFSADEAAALKRCPVEERPSRFCELWTLKEALLKAVGTGLVWPLNCASFHVRGRHVSVTRMLPLPENHWAFLLMDVKATHKLAIAISDTPSEGPLIRVTAADAFAVVEGILARPRAGTGQPRGVQIVYLMGRLLQSEVRHDGEG
jgi:4'-phosphopantetheinyl transferase